MVRRVLVWVLAFSFLAGVAYAGVSSYKDLYRFLPAISGWKCSEPEGVNMENPQGRLVTATRRCLKEGNEGIVATIIMGTSAMMAWAPFQMGMTMETPEVYMKTFEYKGLKAGVNYNKKEKGGSIVVQLSTSPPAAFVLQFESMDYHQALKLLDNFDVKGMASAVK